MLQSNHHCVRKNLDATPPNAASYCCHGESTRTNPVSNFRGFSLLKMRYGIDEQAVFNK